MEKANSLRQARELASPDFGCVVVIHYVKMLGFLFRRVVRTNVTDLCCCQVPNLNSMMRCQVSLLVQAEYLRRNLPQ